MLDHFKISATIFLEHVFPQPFWAVECCSSFCVLDQYSLSYFSLTTIISHAASIGWYNCDKLRAFVILIFVQILVIKSAWFKPEEHSRDSDRRQRTRRVQAQEVTAVLVRLLILNIVCNLDRVTDFWLCSYFILLIVLHSFDCTIEGQIYF
jgi:hypothetical protein